MSQLRSLQEAVDYARRLTELVGLRDWRIDGHDAAPADVPGYGFNTEAEIEPHPHANFALLRVADRLFDAEPDVQRHVIVHELLHCHRARTDWMVGDDLEDLVGKTVDRLFWSGYSRQREIEIESVAAVLAPFLPLP